MRGWAIFQLEADHSGERERARKFLVSSFGGSIGGSGEKAYKERELSKKGEDFLFGFLVFKKVSGLQEGSYQENQRERKKLSEGV